MRLLQVLLLAALPFLATAKKPTVYFIRHGEKPRTGNGLNAQGKLRAECLREIFGPGSKYKIGHIMAQTYTNDGEHKRSYDTMAPLAKDLNLTVDVSCSRDDIGCVADTIRNYTGHGNILVCWEHKNLSLFVAELGDPFPPKCHKHEYNKIWVDPWPYDEVVQITKQDCREWNLEL